MDQSILNLQDYTAASSWRRRDQLRGLLSNHSDLVTSSVSLAAPGVLFTSAQVALHNTENGLAVALSPLMGTSAVGLMPLDEAVPSLNAAARMRWLDMTEDTKTSCMEWCDSLLFVGSSRGRVLVGDVAVEGCRESSGLFSPCGALLTNSSEVVLSRVTVSPSAPTASTLVRSVRVNQGVSKTSALGVQDTSVYLWDLGGGSLPVQQWLPHRHIDAATPVMFAEWAPESATVVLSGTYDSSVMLVDTRNTAARNSVSFSCRRAGGRAAVAHCGEFNRHLPSIVAVSFSDGTVAVYDARYPLQAVQTITTLQGDAVRLRWWRHNADLLTTAGSDGSVALWNLRCPPSFCVGRALYKTPLSDLAMTNTFSEQRAIAITIGGELSMTGLQPEALMGLAPALSYGKDGAERKGNVGSSSGSAAASPSPRITADEEEALRKEERDACGFLYLRRLKEAYQMLAQCASRRLALHQTDIAMQLISHIDVIRVPLFDYSGFVEQLHSAANGADDLLQVLEESGWSYETVRLQFEASLLHCSSHLSTTVTLHRIRAMPKPNMSDVQTLEALRLNVMLQRVLDSEDVEQVVVSVRTALDLIMAHPGISELIDVRTVGQILRLLLRKSYLEGEKFVQFLLSQLHADREQTGVPYQLLRAVMSAAQEPTVTAGVETRMAHRFVERFYRDMTAAKDAVLTQLHIQRLGVEHYREVITVVNAYQERCIQKNLPGMFGWIALKPLLLFLHCLTADSNYVTFFWVSVQYIEAFAHFPGVRKVEAVLFAVVDRIHTAAGKLANDLDEFTDTTRFSIPMLRDVDTTLRTTHEFLTVLIRVQLECENVAVARNMRAMPPVMEQVQDVLSSASEDVLDVWAEVMDALLECNQPDMIRKYCLATVRTFSEQMEDLMEVSAKGEADERLNEILDVCDDFFAAMRVRRVMGGGDA